MFRRLLLLVPWLLVLSLGAVRPAAAQWAVVDVGAIAQLIQQYQTLQEQLTTARDHLEQARQEYAALTGNRGMQHLLDGELHNYLPGHWEELQDALYGRSGNFSAYASRARGFLETNAVLTPDQLALFSARDQLHIDDMRHSVASLQALSQQALGETSDRFNALQALIAAIGSANASDPKGIMDLQARIQAEQVRLTNYAIKVRTLSEAVQAEQAAERQRRREQAIADIGSYRNLPPLELPLPETLP